MARVFLGVGSNEGDRLAIISWALRQLGETPGVQMVQMATISETEAVGGPAQGLFLNTVVELETTLSPATLLATLQQIERACGRRPSAVRWGPRPIDLDILLYDDQMIRTATLTIPHPLLHARRFVLEPMAQLAPTFVHPILRRSIADLLADVRDEASS